MVHAVSNSEELFDYGSNPKRDPSSDPKRATYTTNRNSPHRLLANSKIPAIIQGVIPPVHQATADGVSTCGGALHVVRTVITEDIVTVTVPSAAGFSKEPTVVNRKVASRPITIDMNTVGVTPRATTQVLIATGTSVTPICIRRQEIDSLRGSIGPQKVRNAIHSKFPLLNFLPNMGTLRPFSVR